MTDYNADGLLRKSLSVLGNDVLPGEVSKDMP